MVVAERLELSIPKANALKALVYTSSTTQPLTLTTKLLYLNLQESKALEKGYLIIRNPFRTSLTQQVRKKMYHRLQILYLLLQPGSPNPNGFSFTVLPSLLSHPVETCLPHQKRSDINVGRVVFNSPFLPHRIKGNLIYAFGGAGGIETPSEMPLFQRINNNSFYSVQTIELS